MMRRLFPHFTPQRKRVMKKYWTGMLLAAMLGFLLQLASNAGAR